MATTLTNQVQSLTTKISQEPQLVLEIEGVPTIYGIGSIKKYIRIGDTGLVIGDLWKIGGYNAVEDQLDAISLEGTSLSIAQQLLQDKGGTSSISSIQISLADINGQITELITPGVVVTDILGRNANVYLGYQNTAFPQDFIPIFLGIVDEITSGSTIVLNVAHPEQKKRVDIMVKSSTVLTEDLDASEATIDVESTTGFLTPSGGGTFRTYIRIDDEIIEYTGLTATSFTGCVRGAMDAEDGRALAVVHEIETEVNSWYRLTGQCLDLALKLMLSGPDEYFAEGVSITNFVNVEEVGLVQDAIYFAGLNVSDRYGVVAGDFITTIDDTIAGNNVSLQTVSEVAVTPFGSYIVVAGAGFVLNNGSAGTIKFKSKYNVLPEAIGLAMGGDQVDVPEFERLRETFTGSLLSYDFYIKDTIKAKDFIDTQLFFPTGAYSLPRKGKISIGFTSPPLRIADTKKLDDTNTAKPQTNAFKRSLNKYFYNNIVYVFNESVLDDGKYLSGTLAASADSRNQIETGNKNMVITAKGLRPSNDTTTTIELITRRLLDRWQFAAESIKIQAKYGITFNVDVGDIVLFGSPNLNLPDTKSATRQMRPRLFEVVNKTLYIKDGYSLMELVDTNYLTDGRFGVVSPASYVAAGSTTTRIKIKRSFQIDNFTQEKTKWADYIGEQILVHNDDWSFEEQTRLISFDPTDSNFMIVDPPLSTPPSEDYIVDIPNYFFDPANDVDGEIYKNVHCFFDPSVEVASGTSSLIFDVASGEGVKFFIGTKIVIHNDDFSVLSPEVAVTDVTGDTITVGATLTFTPLAGYFVDLIGFAEDSGAPYRYI